MEEAVGAEGVVASNRPFAVTSADGDGGIVAAFGILGAGAIARHRGSWSLVGLGLWG